MRSRVVTPALAAAVAVVLAACSAQAPGTPNESDSPRSGGTLVAGAPAETATIDPILETALPSILVIRPMYDTLIRFTTDLGYEPQLAKSWEVSADRTTITFTLRDGVKFHSGKTLTADDVIYSFERLRSAQSIHAGLYSTIKKIEKTGDMTVAFTQTTPAPEALLATLAVAPAVIMDKDVVSAKGDLKRADAGTGPFMFDSWQPGTALTLAKNPNYWDAGKPYLDKLVFKFFSDEGSAAAALRSGDIDWFQFSDPLAAEQLKNDPTVTYSAPPSLAYTYISMNTTRAPFNNVKARLGISQALDRKAITEVAVGDTGEVTGPLTPAQNLAVPQSDYPTYTYDADKAKSLLAEGGLAPGATLTLTVNSSNKDAVAAAPAIVDQLGKVGLTVKIEQLESGVWLDHLSKQNYEFILGYSGGYPNPDIPMYNGFTCAGAWNWSKICDTDFEKAIIAARAAQGQERIAAYRAIQHTLVNDLSPYVYLFAKKSLWGWSTKVHGFAPFALIERRFETTWIAG